MKLIFLEWINMNELIMLPELIRLVESISENKLKDEQIAGLKNILLNTYYTGSIIGSSELYDKLKDQY